MAPPHQSPRVPSSSTAQLGLHESVSGTSTRSEKVDCFWNEEELQLSGSETTDSSSGRDPSLGSYRGIPGTKCLLSDGEDEIDCTSNRRKRKRLTKDAKGTTANAKMMVQTKTAKHDSFDEQRNQSLASRISDDQSRNHYFDEDGLDLVESSVTSVKHETKVDCRRTTGEKVLDVLAGMHFNAPEQEVHLRDSLGAVITAYGGSLTAIEFMTSICSAADSMFVPEIVFQSESLTPKVANWIIEFINKQDMPSRRFVHLLVKFVCGNAPLEASRRLLHYVEPDGNSTYLLRGEEYYPVWLYCLINSKDRVNDLRLRLVLRNVVNPSWRDSCGGSALHHSVAYYDQPSITEFLVNERNMDVNEQTTNGVSALMLAIAMGHANVTEFLASSPSTDLELQNEIGWNALHCAAVCNRLQVAEFLVERMDVNLQDHAGNSALIYAVFRGHTEIAKLLALHPFAQLDLRNADRVTARDIAIGLNRQELIGIL